VAVVTGGGKGIGKHYVKGLAAEGAAVVIAEIDAEAAQETAKEITTADGRALAVQTDVADEASVNRMVEKTVSTFGKIDILVNNAAIFAAVKVKRGPHDKIAVEEWDRMFAVNVRGVWLCCKAVFPHMSRQEYGKIINISSGTAWGGTPYMLHYVTSKAAVAGLTRALAREVGKSGIRVNTIAPGLTASETYLPYLDQRANEQVIGNRCIARSEVPEDLVGAVIFLSSPESDFITGQTIQVNGGTTLS
jgi:3-oxoacyl-[acyl-carrier protein] reductase